MSDCLQSTINLVRAKYLKVAEFDVTCDPDVLLFCYPIQLNQVFMNLFINACDAIKQKQQLISDPELKVAGKVFVSCHQRGDVIKIMVKDDGCGMDEVTKNKLFEPFYTTKEVGEGTGLGLAISYGIVQQHEGKLEVESEQGEGTCFNLTLPIFSKKTSTPDDAFIL